jgi:hypothetical protein
MRTWIFQGNPDDYDIDGYLDSRPARLTWLVTRYAHEIAVEDRVFLWRNQGARGSDRDGSRREFGASRRQCHGPGKPVTGPCWQALNF